MATPLAPEGSLAPESQYCLAFSCFKGLLPMLQRNVVVCFYVPIASDSASRPLLIGLNSLLAKLDKTCTSGYQKY